MSQLIFLVAILSFSVHAETLFEGYYKIEVNGKHVGFAVQRLQFDPGTKTRTLRYFIHTVNGNRQSVKTMVTAKQTENYRPIEYQSQLTVGERTEREQVTFKNNSYQEIFSALEGKTTKAHALPMNAFLSSAVDQVFLANAPTKGKVYSYSAVREDDAKLIQGQIRVLNITKIGPRTLFQILDDFENSPQETWLLDNGQALRTAVPDRHVVSTLVASADEAIGAIDFKRSELVALFSEIPTGAKNVVASKQVRIESGFFSSNVDTKYGVVKSAIPLKLPALKGAVSK